MSAGSLTTPEVVRTPLMFKRDNARSPRGYRWHLNVVWAMAGCTVVLAGHSLVAIGSATLLLGVWIYWWHGGHQITAAGLYSFATAIFVGFSAIWWGLQASLPEPGMFAAATISYFVLLAMACFWPDRHYAVLQITSQGNAAAAWGAVASLVLVVPVIAYLLPTSFASQAVPIQIALGAMGLLAACLVTFRPREGKSLRRLWLAALVVLAFAQYAFRGYGRLNLVALGFIALVVASSMTRTRLLKGLTVVSVPPALVAFTIMRAQFLQQQYGQSGSGPGSVVTPLRDFAALLRLGDLQVFSYAHGHTFLASALVWFPRSLWGDKPIGFGGELTRVLRPDLVSIKQSMAALSQGEWYFDFGWLGIAAMVPVLALLIRLLDSVMRDLVAKPLDSRRRLIGLVLVVTLVSDMPNLMWVGTFGFTSRDLFRIVPLLLLLPFASRGRSPRPSLPGRPARSRPGRRHFYTNDLVERGAVVLRGPDH